jgi:hypothetical protein
MEECGVRTPGFDEPQRRRRRRTPERLRRRSRALARDERRSREQSLPLRHREAHLSMW